MEENQPIKGLQRECILISGYFILSGEDGYSIQVVFEWRSGCLGNGDSHIIMIAETFPRSTKVEEVFKPLRRKQLIVTIREMHLSRPMSPSSLVLPSTAGIFNDSRRLVACYTIVVYSFIEKRDSILADKILLACKDSVCFCTAIGQKSF